MKITKKYLQKIITEELNRLAEEEQLDEDWRRKLKNLAIGTGAAIAGLTGIGGKAQAKEMPSGPAAVSTTGYASTADIKDPSLLTQYKKLFSGYQRFAVPPLEADSLARAELQKQGFEIEQRDVKPEDTIAYKRAFSGAMRMGASEQQARKIALEKASGN